MAFALLTYRESLRDIEACLLANQTKLYSSQTVDISRRQRSTRLAHLGRLGDIADPACTQTVLQRL